MNTKDLREGNLILTSKDAGGAKFLRSIVKEIHTGYVIVEGDRKVRIEDCAGLPLTEELVLKLGAQQTGKNIYFSTPEFNLGSIEFHTDACYLVFEGTQCGTAIKHVHHLQNLFYYLQGTELSFVN